MNFYVFSRPLFSPLKPYIDLKAVVKLEDGVVREWNGSGWAISILGMLVTHEDASFHPNRQRIFHDLLL